MSKLIKKSIIILLLGVLFALTLNSCTRRRVDVSNFKTIEEFNRKDVKIGVPISSRIAEITEKVLNNSSIEYFSSGPDQMSALEQRKVDALILEEYAVYLLKGDSPFLHIVDDGKVGETEIAFAFPKTDKGKKLHGELNEFIARLKQSGELQKMIDYWMDLGLPPEIQVDFSDLENINGEISMFTEAQGRPFSFVYYGKNVGLELEIVRMFAKEKGYAVNLVRTSSVLPALTSGKCDIVGSAMEIMKEKESKIYFSDPIYVAEDYIVIRDPSFVKESNFVEGLKTGFKQTFISEGRYKLFINGTLTTIVISMLTLILGTLIGFLLYIAYYNGFTFIAKVFNFLSWLFSRLPMVVFLMFILYVVFEKVDISGVIVGVISFTIVFATTVFSILESNVKNIEHGQIEAASSLGYNRIKIFFKIILLQILPNALPTYRAEILSLVKSTSIVGYVMVSDLTKVGDLVRSRTYAPFFPLIVVAIIYIILAKVITVIIDGLSKVLLKKLKIEKEKLKETKEND